MSEPSVRLDRWLWAARWFKTRSLATVAVAGGKVHLDGRRVKPSAPVRIGDRIEVRKGPYAFDLVVTGLAERRGPAREARQLYDETEESVRARELRRVRTRQAPTPTFEGKGRPTKRDRRALDRLRRPDGS